MLCGVKRTLVGLEWRFELNLSHMKQLRVFQQQHSPGYAHGSRQEMEPRLCLGLGSGQLKKDLERGDVSSIHFYSS